MNKRELVFEMIAWTFVVLGTALIFGVFFLGCSTVNTRFRETVTDADGTVAVTDYRAMSLAPPLGKLDTSSHQWRYVWGGPENTITTGQDMRGMDNTGQAVLIPLLQTLVDALVKANANVPVAPPVSLPDAAIVPFVLRGPGK